MDSKSKDGPEPIDLMGIVIEAAPEDLDGFITPNWKQVLDFYPKWVRRVEKKGDIPWKVQAYMLGFADELEKRGIRNRTSNDWMVRCFQHFGLNWIGDYADRYKGLGE